MRAIFEAADGNYGVPRMFKELRRSGLTVNKKRVHRLMRRHGMAGRHHRRRCRTTFPGPDGYVIPDLVGRRFDPGRPDVAWAQDITYIPTQEGWLFLASVLDLGSRRLLGYSMADHMRSELVLDALGMAIAAPGGDSAVHGVIVHANPSSTRATTTSTSASTGAASSGLRSAAPGCAGTAMILVCCSGRPDPCYDRPCALALTCRPPGAAHRSERLPASRAGSDLIGA